MRTTIAIVHNLQNNLILLYDNQIMVSLFTFVLPLTFIVVVISYRITPAARTLSASQTIAETIVSSVMHSPLNIFLFDAARNTMIKSVEAAGMNWKGSYKQLVNAQDWKEAVQNIKNERLDVVAPSYYLSPFHAYPDGNLCLDAAFEQEIAGKAVGIRHFPSQKKDAEAYMRTLFDDALVRMGGTMIPGSSSEHEAVQILDFGCGTGTSTRRLASVFASKNTKLLGIDLSPHMIAVGRLLQKAVPAGKLSWLEDIVDDPRISYIYGDIANMSSIIPDNSVSFINIAFVLHELPTNAAITILKEAFRVLRPGGVVNIVDMDPDSPGYLRARSNPFLFAIFQSTEPFLDDYFDQTYPSLCNEILPSIGFQNILQVDATSRYLSVLARKPTTFLDLRSNYVTRGNMDTHLAPLHYQ